MGLLAALEGIHAPSPAYRFVGASAPRTLLLGRIKAALGALLGGFGDSSTLGRTLTRGRRAGTVVEPRSR